MEYLKLSLSADIGFEMQCPFKGFPLREYCMFLFFFVPLLACLSLSFVSPVPVVLIPTLFSILLHLHLLKIKGNLFFILWFTTQSKNAAIVLTES